VLIIQIVSADLRLLAADGRDDEHDKGQPAMMLAGLVYAVPAANLLVTGIGSVRSREGRASRRSLRHSGCR
jgi:hypothetical protein